MPNTIVVERNDWTGPSCVRIRSGLAGSWTTDASYVDPLMGATGHADIAILPCHIAMMIEGARAQLPGLGFVLVGKPDGHGDFVRFSWKAGPDGGDSLIEGTDVVNLDADCRTAAVVGFLDKVSAAER